MSSSGSSNSDRLRAFVNSVCNEVHEVPLPSGNVATMVRRLTALEMLKKMVDILKTSGSCITVPADDDERRGVCSHFNTAVAGSRVCQGCGHYPELHRPRTAPVCDQIDKVVVTGDKRGVDYCKTCLFSSAEHLLDPKIRKMPDYARMAIMELAFGIHKIADATSATKQDQQIRDMARFLVYDLEQAESRHSETKRNEV